MSDNPVLVVTGASAGIGAAAARLFAANGYRVVLAARRLERLHALADEIRAQGGQALPVQTDVSHLEDVRRLVQASLENYNQIDILFNNAGFGRLNWLENLDPETDIQSQVMVNLLGMIWVAQSVLPHMISRQSGHIINMSSVAGLLATPTYTVYDATKFGGRGFSAALRREVGVHGIRVSTICPGPVATEFSEIARIKRKTGVTTPGVLRLSAEDVAEAVWGLVRRPRRCLVIPWPLRLAVWADRIAPGAMDWAMKRFFVRPERKGEAST